MMHAERPHETMHRRSRRSCAWLGIPHRPIATRVVARPIDTPVFELHTPTFVPSPISSVGRHHVRPTTAPLARARLNDIIPRHVRTVVSFLMDLSEALISQLCGPRLLRRRHNFVSPEDGRGGLERVWTKGAIRRAASRRVALLRSRTHASSAGRSRCRSDIGRTCTCRRRRNARCVDGVPRGVSLHVLGRVSLHARNAVYAA